MSVQVATLDELQSIQHVPKFNQLLRALSAPAAFTIMRRYTVGLNLAVRGGVFRTPSGVPTILAMQRFLLAPSTTTYVYRDDAGEVFATTSAPVGWPNPTSGVIALYQLDTDANQITDGTCFIASRASPGPAGRQGIQGSEGTPLQQQRVSVFHAVGASSSSASTFGFINFGGSARSLDVTFVKMIPFYAALGTGSVANTATAFRDRVYWRGNVARAGGFKVAFRFILDTATANHKVFVGVLSTAVSTPAGSSEPSTFTDCVGIGTDSGESNYYLIHNDSSGAATKTLLTSDDSPTVNFAARTAFKIYELTIECDANGSQFVVTLLNPEDLHYCQRTVTTNMPASTVFFNATLWMSNGATASPSQMNFAQVIGNTRY